MSILSDILSTILGIATLGTIYKFLSNKFINGSSKVKMRPSEGYGCPKCYSEYNTDFDTCADCHIPLVSFDKSNN